MATKRAKKTRYFKFLKYDNLSPFAYFDYSEYLPKDGKPGAWMPLIKSLRMCERGYHACEASKCSVWADDMMFEVELRGTIKQDKYKEKFVAQQMRFLRKIRGYSYTRFTKHADSINFKFDTDEEEDDDIEKYVLKMADKSR